MKRFQKGAFYTALQGSTPVIKHRGSLQTLNNTIVNVDSLPTPERVVNVPKYSVSIVFVSTSKCGIIFFWRLLPQLAVLYKEHDRGLKVPSYVGCLKVPPLIKVWILT